MTDDTRFGRSDVSIGQINGDVGSIGPGSSGRVHKDRSSAPELGELRRCLDELHDLVERHAAELDDRDTARKAVAQARNEVRSGDPQPRKLASLLSTITGAASSVSAVTGAVSGIRQLLSGLS
jgi:hypothetical protein